MLHVPIIVRSLAESFSILEEDQLPISMASDYLLTLDLDLTFQNSSCRIVDEYECAWWKGRKPRSLETVLILNSTSLEKCLELHHEQIVGAAVSPTEYTHPSVLPDLDANAEPSQCTKCDQYREILNHTLQDILDLNAFADAILTDVESQWNLNMRRASTFYLLHEASVNKEFSGTSSATSAPSAKYTSEMVSQRSREEFNRLSNLCPSSYKWTWGKDLTEHDVLELRRTTTRPRNREHSGYCSSLRDGNLGNGSPFPSLPTSSIFQNDPPPTVSDSPIPDYNLPEISYFKKRRNLVYDPLDKTDRHPICLSSSPAELTSANVTHNADILIDAEDELASSNISKSNIDVADVWRSGSDESGESVERRPSAVTSADVEAIWVTDSGSDGDVKAATGSILKDNASEVENIWCQIAAVMTKGTQQLRRT